MSASAKSKAPRPAGLEGRVEQHAQRHRHDPDEQADQPQRAEAARVGVATATSMVCSNGTPARLSRTMPCVSPCTQG